MLEKIHVQTAARSQMIDITAKVQNIIREARVADGFVIVYCTHTTAGITINEGADPDVIHDMLLRLDELYPWNHPSYRHIEGNSAAHLKATAVGASQSIPLVNGRMILGAWQAIYFCEFDGPRSRTAVIKVVSS